MMCAHTDQITSNTAKAQHIHVLSLDCLLSACVLCGDTIIGSGKTDRERIKRSKRDGKREREGQNKELFPVVHRTACHYKRLHKMVLLLFILYCVCSFPVISLWLKHCIFPSERAHYYFYNNNTMYITYMLVLLQEKKHGFVINIRTKHAFTREM